jgi:hypothetical protein
MKLKRLFIAEIVIVAIILVSVMVVIEGIPYLEASRENSSVSMYQEKEYAKGIVTLARGEAARTGFNYSTYDPAILVLELSFQIWQSPGNLTFYCNKEYFASIIATPERPNISLVVISVSGEDWVKTSSSTKRPANSTSTYDNEITFSSNSLSGYAGTFNYRIVVRGSR